MRYLAITALLGLCAGVGLLLPNGPARAEEKKAEGWGTIKGQVVFAEGVDVPKPEKVDVNQDQMHCLEKGNIFREEWIVNKGGNRGVKNVFVWLTPDATKPTAAPAIKPSLANPKAKEVEIDQPCCKFEPHALGLRVGQDLLAKNSSPVTHNINWVDGNISIPAGKSYAIQGLKATKIPIPVSCNIHRWMSARVGVFDHPYFAVTDENGNFEIKDAPAGEIYLILNHEGAGWCGLRAGKNYGKKIEIKANGTTDLGKFEIKPTE
jgi:hypothetical protein